MTLPFTLNSPQGSTKGEVKRLRLAGFIPVSIQRKGTETKHYQIETAPLQEFLRVHGRTALVDFVIMPGGIRQRGIMQSMQRDGISLKIQQATFKLVNLEDTLQTDVPIVFTGHPTMANAGEAVVLHQLERLDIECTQGNLPEHILVDVTNLHPGGSVRVSDIPVSAHYKIVTPQDTVLASLTRTRGGSATQTTAESGAGSA